jgi:predicted metal-dependent hydrolase
MRRNRPPLICGSRLPLLDEQLTLVVCMDAQRALLPAAGDAPTLPKRAAGSLRKRSGTVYRERDRLCVELRTLRMGALRELLEAWFREEAARRLPARLRDLSSTLGVRPRRIKIRVQKSRWGSCSMDGEINLNWRLVLLPSALADYILVHELCHLRHLDHSPSFWRLVASLVPDYKRRRASIAALQPSLAL